MSITTRRRELPPAVRMSPDDDAGLRRVQIELFEEFDRICREHGLEYFALYGTALGAVRHGGFIPWDDDIDVAMLRPQFDRLVEVMRAERDDRYFFQTVDTDPHYGCLFAKLRRNGTRCVDRDGYGSAQHSGIFLDIFPIDAKATGGWRRLAQKAVRNIGFRLLYIKSGYRFMTGTSWPSRLAQAVATLVGRTTPRRTIIALMNWHTRLGPADPAEYVCLFGAYPYDHATIQASWIHPLVELPFEHRTIPAMGDTEAYLTQIYGDWATPPPPDQRVGHHELYEFDLGDATVR